MEQQREGIDIEARDEEYARRVMREVHYMKGTPRDKSLIREEGELYDESEEREEELLAEKIEREEREEERGERASTKKRPNIVWLLISGNILIIKGLTKYYGQMVIIAALFLLSIIVMFWSLHLDMQYNALVRDVQLLRERSIRLKEVRFSRSSHSSIVEELKRRGIELEDPTTPATVIEKKRGLW